MRKLSFITLLALVPFFVSAKIEGAKHALYYRIENCEGGEVVTPKSFPSKKLRSSKDAGIIKIITQGEFPDSIVASFQLAADVWAAKIKNRLPIYINLINETIEPQLAMLVAPFYDEKYKCPSALASQLSGELTGDYNDPHSFIFFNSDITWNCRLSEDDNASGLNVYSNALRAIALSLGFGSSVTYMDEPEEIVFQEGYPSPFDSLIFSENIKLSSFVSASAGLKAFVTRPDIYVSETNPEYKLYSPSPFKLGQSLVFLDNPHSLMHYSFGIHDRMFSIDNVTLDLLNTIGWGFTTPKNTTIICDNIDNDGIGSAYENHTFSLSSNDISEISHYKWSFKLEDTDGGFVEIKTGEQPNFTIEPIGDSGNYAHTASGDISGLIECEYTINGERTNAHPFRISLEKKPRIVSITDVNRVWAEEDSDYFYLTFNVNYYGADRIDVRVEEEYSSALRYIGINEPIIAHVKTGLINSLYYSWVDIIVQNQYGSAQETIELEPFIGESQFNRSVQTEEYNDITVYDMCGAFVKKFASERQMSNGLAKGLYIVQKNKNGIAARREIILIK